MGEGVCVCVSGWVKECVCVCVWSLLLRVVRGAALTCFMRDRVSIAAPFHDDPRPSAPAGSMMKLWDYEVWWL